MLDWPRLAYHDDRNANTASDARTIDVIVVVRIYHMKSSYKQRSKA